MRPYAGVFLLLFILFGVLGRSLGMIRIVKKASALFSKFTFYETEKSLNNGQL